MFLHLAFIPVSLMLQLHEFGSLRTILWMLVVNLMVFGGLNLIYMLVAILQSDQLPKRILVEGKSIYFASLFFITLLFMLNLIKFTTKSS